MTKHQAETYMGIDLAAPNADRSVPYRLIRGDGLLDGGVVRPITDLGVSVEEAPEAPQNSPARRVTAEGIEAKITQEDYIEAIGGRLTVCVLTLANGFLVTGESACVDSCNYDAALGRKIARANAFEKLWPLEGYLLRDQIEAERDVTTFGQTNTAPEPANNDGSSYSVVLTVPGFADYGSARAYEDKLTDAFMDMEASVGLAAFCRIESRDSAEASRMVGPKADTASDMARAADEGWDDPEALSDTLFHNLQHGGTRVGTQGASATFTDRAWLRQRAFELAQVDNTHLEVKDLIESARLIEAYIAGQPEHEPATEAAPATDAELIQRAKDVLVDAVTRGEAPVCDQAADAIHAMADWLNGVTVRD